MLLTLELSNTMSAGQLILLPNYTPTLDHFVERETHFVHTSCYFVSMRVEMVTRLLKRNCHMYVSLQTPARCDPVQNQVGIEDGWTDIAIMM